MGFFFCCFFLRSRGGFGAGDWNSGGVTFSTCNDICYKGLGKEKAYNSVLHKKKSCYICMIPCIFLRDKNISLCTMSGHTLKTNNS